MGRAPRGPVSQPTLISSYKDYERSFGALSRDCPLGYAVSDFFRNGGGQAVIVRLFHLPTQNGQAVSGLGKLSLSNLDLVATDPGAWSTGLLVAVDYRDVSSDNAKEIAKNLGVTSADLFNLTVTLSTSTGTVSERFANLTVKDTVRRIDRVLAQSSKLVRVAVGTSGQPSFADTPPAESSAAASGEVGVRVSTGSAADSAPLDATDYNFSVLDKADTVNLLCLPPDTRAGDTPAAVYSAALQYCVKRRSLLVVDPPAAWAGKAVADIRVSDLGLSGPMARNAAVYYPRVTQADPLNSGLLDQFAPCGIVAGVISRTDVARGVWKAPAGLDAALAGVDSLTPRLTDSDSGVLNPQGINCLRSFPASGQVVWGARTLRGADALADEYKYLPVRRLALYLEESIYRGTQWAVFEPNDERLWAQLRLNVGSFMQGLFRQGAFQGQSPREAYFVKCDKETTTADDINAGTVNIIVGFAPLKPAEFVVIKFQQMAGQNSA
jgi:phage tail sheath protein FI